MEKREDYPPQCQKKDPFSSSTNHQATDPVDIMHMHASGIACSLSLKGCGHMQVDQPSFLASNIPEPIDLIPNLKLNILSIVLWWESLHIFQSSLFGSDEKNNDTVDSHFTPTPSYTPFSPISSQNIRLRLICIFEGICDYGIIRNSLTFLYPLWNLSISYALMVLCNM